MVQVEAEGRHSSAAGGVPARSPDCAGRHQPHLLPVTRERQRLHLRGVLPHLLRVLCEGAVVAGHGRHAAAHLHRHGEPPWPLALSLCYIYAVLKFIP